MGDREEGVVGDREIMGERERMREKERTMSAREGEQVTEVGDTEKEIMDNRKRQRQGRERGREGMPEEEKEGATGGEGQHRVEASRGYREHKGAVGKRGAGGRASPRESMTDTECVTESLYATEGEGVAKGKCAESV